MIRQSDGDYASRRLRLMVVRNTVSKKNGELFRDVQRLLHSSSSGLVSILRPVRLGGPKVGLPSSASSTPKSPEGPAITPKRRATARRQPIRTWGSAISALSALTVLRQWARRAVSVHETLHGRLCALRVPHWRTPKGAHRQGLLIAWPRKGGNIFAGRPFIRADGCRAAGREDREDRERQTASRKV